MVLSEVARGEAVEVTEVSGDAGLVRRLALIGLRPGAEVVVAARTCGAAVRLDLASGQVALAASVLSSVSVRPCRGRLR